MSGLDTALLVDVPHCDNQGTEDVVFHSLFTDEGNRDEEGRPTTWRAIQTRDTPLEFFNE